MSTVSGGHVPSSCAAVLPPTLVEFLTVGSAAAGNFLFLPSSRTPPARGLVLTGWPPKLLITARRAASASPVVESTSATRATTIAGEGMRRLMPHQTHTTRAEK